MADFTQTITNRVGLFSAEPTQKWGTLVWGTNEWAYDNDLIVNVGKNLTETVTMTGPTLNFDIVHILDSQDVTMTSLIVAFSSIIVDPITNSLSMTNLMSGLTLVDSEGFYHVFRGNVTEGEDQITTSYTLVSSDDVTWSPASDPSTTWS